MNLQKDKKQPAKGVLKNCCTYLLGDLDFLIKMYLFCFGHDGKKKPSLFSQVKGVLRATFWGTALSDSLSNPKSMQSK